MNTSMRLLAPVFLVAIGITPLCAQPEYEHPFQNPDMPLEERVNNIISLMTRDEKILLLSQTPGVPRLGIRTMQQTEGLHGVRAGGGTTTTYPQSIGLGETWDPEILRQVGATEGYEARYVFQRNNRGAAAAEAPPTTASTNGAPARGGRRGGGGSLIIRAPNADLGRDIRWGRTEECYGEDPFLNGTLAVAFIKGMQGDDPRYWQAAALHKHFLANSNENGRSGSSSDFDERLFYEYYSVPFRMGFVEGGARCFMASYNAWNKVPMTVNPIIQKVVVPEWGVDGVICTDAGSLANMISPRAHHYYPNLALGAAGSIKDGINQFLDTYDAPTRNALSSNMLTLDDIEKSIKGTFRIFIRLGLLDPPDHNPYARIGADVTAPWATQKARDSVRLATQESVVLLKNSGNFLPLSKTAFKTIAVIGPRGNEVVRDWYGSTPPYTVTPLAGIKSKVGDAASVQFADGRDVTNAVALAESSDLVILCVGNNPNPSNTWMRVDDNSEGREAIDRVNITLGSGQEELVEKVCAANPKTVVVLISSFPYAINWAQENAPAIVHLANSSQELGNGLADVLFGDYNPAGRTSQTWPKSTNDIPPMMDYNIRHGRTYMYSWREPLYPFGFGLSYTTFAYSNLRTSAASLDAKGALDVSVDVKNTGDRAGDEVVQLYVKHNGSAVDRPARELRGFKRVPLEAGETKTVTMTLPASRLAYWDATGKAWVVENDSVQLMIGGSSADTKLSRTIEVTQ
jgi:beta-glucosidase